MMAAPRDAVDKPCVHPDACADAEQRGEYHRLCDACAAPHRDDLSDLTDDRWTLYLDDWNSQLALIVGLFLGFVWGFLIWG